MGDFNVDIRKDSNIKYELLSLLQSYNFEHNIEQYTQITPTSKSEIDIIFTNFTVLSAYVIHTGISGHTAQMIKFELQNKRNNNSFEIRFFTNRIFSVLFTQHTGHLCMTWHIFSNIFVLLL